MEEIASHRGTLGRLIIDAIARFGDRPAFSDGTVHWTYREFGEEVGRYITLFRSLGLGKSNGILLLTNNRAEPWPAVCAANLMGIRYTPLHPMAAEDDHVHVATDSEADLLIVDAANYGVRARAIAERARNIRHVLSIGPLEGAVDLTVELPTLSPSELVDEAEPEDIAWLSYTGGTTGLSKGVMLSHRCVTTYSVLVAAEWDWPEPLRYAIVTPLSHSAGIKAYPVMLRGGFSRFLPGFDAAQLCAAIQDEKLTATFLVPTLVNRLVEARDIRQKYDLTSLQLIIYGAAPISPDRLRIAIEELGPIFLQLFGQSEYPEAITTLRKVDHDLSKPERLESCGRPLTFNEVRLLDSDGNEVADGEPGEICVRGALASSGYWRKPDLTEQLFAGGWVHTGDVARRDKEGYLYIVDRIKDMIISGGFNIFPREVEDALMQHPAVSLAAVIGVPDQDWGEAVKAVVQLREGAEVSSAELRAHVKACRGAPWAPKMIDFVADIPLTSLGKIDRKALRSPHWQNRGRAVA